MVGEKLYNCILSQILSPCGDLLLCGNIYGDIAVFELGSLLEDSKKIQEKGPKCTFKPPNNEQVCSMASTATFFLAGTVGAIFAWGWDSIKNSSPELSWTINLPSSKERLQKTDVNALLVSHNDINLELYAGCGDNNIYAFSLEDGKLVRTFEGHSDYIHSLSMHEWRMASASEDGTVTLWDMRKGGMTSKIEPYKEQKLTRPHLGKWIGDVSVTNDWLVCGGGPRCSLWHTRTMSMMTSFSEFEIPDFEIHVANIHSDSVLCGGASSHFYRASFTGELLSKMTTSAITLYSAVVSDANKDILLTLAGSGNTIDVCTNFTYRHKSLHFYI